MLGYMGNAGIIFQYQRYWRHVMQMDTIDRKILALVQQDASLSMAALADQVGLSATPYWRRLQKLEDTGIIKRRVGICIREYDEGVSATKLKHTWLQSCACHRRDLSTCCF